MVLIPFGFVGIALAVVAFVLNLIVLSLKNLGLNFLGLSSGPLKFWEALFSWVFFGILVLGIPFFVEEFRMYQASQLMASLLICMGLNILVGFSRQLSLGQGAFVLVGAFTSAIFFNGEHVTGQPLYVCFLLGGLLSAFFGVLLGLPSLRVRGPYLALITLTFSMVVSLVIRSQYLDTYTGGATGISVNTLAVPDSLSEKISDIQWQYFVLAIPAFFLVLIVSFLLNHHRVGRALKCLGQSEELAKSIGINILGYRLFAFAMSAFLAGVGGGFYSIIVGAMQPKSFTVYDSINYLTATVVGGPGSILGSFFGAIFLSIQVELAQFLGGFFPNGEALATTLFGVVLVIFMMYVPAGVAGKLREVVNNIILSKPTRFSSYRELKFYRDKKDLFNEK